MAATPEHACIVCGLGCWPSSYFCNECCVLWQASSEFKELPPSPEEGPDVTYAEAVQGFAKRHAAPEVL